MTSHSIGNGFFVIDHGSSSYVQSMLHPPFGSLFEQHSTAIHELPPSSSENEQLDKLKLFSVTKHICTYYFHGLEITVDLLTAIQCLLKLIRSKLMPVLKLLINNQWLIEQVTEKYIEFLSKNDNTIQCKQCLSSSYRSSTRLASDVENDFERDAIHAIWICHMIDSWAYYNDCKEFGNGSMKDHYLLDNFLDCCYQMYTSKNDYSEFNNKVKPTSTNNTLSIQVNNAITWLYRMCRTFLLPHFQDVRFQYAAIRRYYCFLAILRSHPAMFSTISRPSDIMLVWLAHSLFPRIYRQDVRLLLGHSSIVLLERVLVQPQSYLPEEIRQIWLEMFGGDLLIPGTLHMPLVPHQYLKPCDSIQLLLKDSLIVSLKITDETRLSIKDCFLKVGHDLIVPVHIDFVFSAPCSTNALPICVRVTNNRGRLSYNVVGFLICPFQHKQSHAKLGLENSICLAANEYTLILSEKSYGIRPLPELIAEFVELPTGHNTNLIMFYGSTIFADNASNTNLEKLARSPYSISFHFLPEVASVFLFIDDGTPSIVSKLVNSVFLPYEQQLDRPDKYAHTNNGCVTLVVHDTNGEQLIFIVNTLDKNEPIKMYTMDSSIICNVPFVELPICTRSAVPFHGFATDTGGGISIKFSHTFLHSPAFPLLLSASLTMFLLNLSNDNKHSFVYNCSTKSSHHTNLKQRSTTSLTNGNTHKIAEQSQKSSLYLSKSFQNNNSPTNNNKSYHF